jgi:hypothetical protein
MNDAENVTGRSASLSWTPGLAVTHLIVAYNYNDEAYRDSIVLDDEAIAAGQYELSGLMSKKTYNVSIWNNDVQRGSVKFTTTEAYPEGYTVARISTADELNALLKDPSTTVAEGGNLVIVIPANSTLAYNGDEEWEHNVPATVGSVIFWGESGGETPVFKPKGLSFTGNHDLVRFYNLDLQNSSNSGDYIVNQSKAGTIGKLLIEGCTISKTRGVVRVQGDGANGSIDSLVINNCVLTDIGSYGVVNSKVSGFAWKSITISKTTVNTVNAAIIASQQPNYTINLENTTLYNCVSGGSSKPFIDSNKETGIVVNATKTIIGKSYSNKIDVVDEESAVTVKATSLKIGEGFEVNETDFYTTADCPYTKNYSWSTILDYTSSELFKDPENGDFTLLKSLNAGDPRWLSEE